MSSVRRSLAIAFIERYLLIALSLGSNMLLARLLTPEEIGLYSVNLAFIGIAHMLRDFGISNFLVQAPELRPIEIRTSFGIALLIGSTLFLLIFLLAPSIADFYSDPRMVETLRLCALNFLLIPFASVPNSLMRRDMQFQRLLYITISATVTGTATTVVLAALAYGPNSMAVGAVVTSAASAIGAYAARRDFWRMTPSLAGWRPIANFGGQSTVTSVITSISMDIHEFAVGKVMGFAPVALISRAQGLMNIIHRDLLSAVRSVAYPSLARTFRDGGSVEAQHVQAIVNMTAVAWPAYGLLAIHSADVIRIMFGPQWAPAAPLVPLFCAAGAFAMVASLITVLLMAVGRIDLVTRAELIIQPARALILVTTVLVFQSIYAFAVVFLIVFAASVPVLYVIKGSAVPTDMKAMRAGLSRSLLCTLPPLALAGAVQMLFQGPEGRIGAPALIGSLAGAVVLWVVSVSMTRHPLSQEALYLRLLRMITPGRSSRKPNLGTPLAKEQPLQVLMVPDWRRGNPYQDLVANAVRAAQPSAEIEFATPPGQAWSLLVLARRHPRARVIHLHWLDNLIEPIAWSQSPWVRRLKLWSIELQLAALRLTGRRIVWTIHNLYAHEGSDRELERRLNRAIGRWATAVTAHSADALALAQREYGANWGARAHVVPHGNYAGCYCASASSVSAVDPRLADVTGLKLLFFGALRPYKGVLELLAALAAVPDLPITVVVAGSGQDGALAEAVRAHARRDPRLIDIVRFITNEEVPLLFDWADAVVVPFERTLTSGSVILAMTMGRPVVLPDGARVIGVANDANTIFFEPGGLAQALARLDQDDLRIRRAACQATAKSLDWVPIGQQLAMLYSDGKLSR